VLTWVGRLGLPAYLGFLVYRALHGGAIEPAPLPSLTPLGAAAVFTFLRELLVRASVDVARLATLGALAALAMPRREGFVARSLGMALPAAALSFAAVTFVGVVDAGPPWTLPGLFALLLPGVSILFGVWVGMTLTRGLGATLFFLPRLALYAVLLLLLAGIGAWRCLEPTPLAFEPTPVTSAEKHRLYGLLRDKAPMRLKEGQTAELRLTPRDVDLLMSWGLSVGEASRKTHVEMTPQAATLQASLRVPRFDRYLNLVAKGQAQVRNGVLDLRGDALQVGQWKAPGWSLGPLSYLVERALNGDRRVRPGLRAVRSLSMDDDGLRIEYGRAQLPAGFVADLFHGEGTGALDLEALRAQLDHLRETASILPPAGEARFGAAVQSAFAFAATRSGREGAVREDRAALLALGLVLGTRRLETFTGRVAGVDLAALGHAFKGSTMRGRDDWPKHFTVSAALTVLSLDRASDAAGVLKEELDANGGSGFSFGDLLADHAGTAFADFATRDEVSARGLQVRLAQGFALDDYFPAADGLPEDIQDRELQAKYGGVGGKEYNRLVAEIERRIAALPAYKP
jgi:hypothetical protein